MRKSLETGKEAERKSLEAGMTNQANGVYEFGPYRLNAANRILTRGGEAVALPPKTLDLLLLLVQSEGRALFKNELMNSLWPGIFVEEANLTFQISTLRKALGEPADAWIETFPTTATASRLR